MIIKQIINAAGILTVGRFVNILSQFAFNAILVRLLMKQDVGDFFLTVSFVSFFSMIATFGGANIAIRKFSEIVNRETPLSAVELLRSFLLVNFIVSLVTIIFFGFLYFFQVINIFKIDYVFSQIIILSCWVWAVGLQTILTEVFRAFGKFLLTTISAGALVNLLNLLVLAILYLFDIPSSFALVLFLCALNVISVTVLSVVVVRKICSDYDNNDLKSQYQQCSGLSMSIFQESIPSFINKMGLYFSVLADLWLIAAFFSKSTVADYGVATKLAGVLSIFLLIANGFVPTFIGKLKNKGVKTVERFLRLSATVVALPSLLLFAFLYMETELVIELVFGVEYIPASSFIKILLLAQLINVIVGSCSYTLVMNGMNTELMKISLSTGILAVLLAFAFLLMGGESTTIAWAFVISSIARHIAVYVAARMYCNINTAIYVNPILFIKNLKLIAS